MISDELVVYIIIAFIILITCGIITDAIGEAKGYKKSFFYIGYLLGVIGIIIAACLPDNSMQVVNDEKWKRYEKIERLYNLREKNIISQEEFEEEKTKIIWWSFYFWKDYNFKIAVFICIENKINLKRKRKNFIMNFRIGFGVFQGQFFVLDNE